MSADEARATAWATLPKLVWDRPSLRMIPADLGPCVYRIWAWPTDPHAGHPGLLLYVGASTDARHRLLHHHRTNWLATQTLAPGVVSIEQFRNATAMARAERRIIDTEQPVVPGGPVRRHGSWKAQCYL